MKLKSIYLTFILIAGFAQAQSPDNSLLSEKNINNIKNFFRTPPVETKKIEEAASQPMTTVDKQTITDATPPPLPIEAEDLAPQEGDGHFWNLQQTDIRAVIQEVSKMTGKNFLIDPKVQGKLSLISNSKIADKDVYPVFLSMLQVAGYSAIPQGDVIKIVPVMDGRTEAAFANPLLHSQSSGDALMVQVIPVHYVPAEQLVPVLRPLMPQWSTVSAYGPSNMLILSGRANNISQLSEIIRQVDTSSANGIDIVPLKHALAMDVTNTLKEILKNQGGNGMRNQPVIAADDRGNSVLLSGNKTDRLRLRLLILELDKKNPNASESNTQVVYLNYMRAEDMVPILAGIAQAGFSGVVGTTIGTSSQPQLDSSNPASNMIPNPTAGTVPPNPPVQTAQNPAGNAANNTQNEGSSKPSVQIIGEPNTNSIIMNGPVSLLKTLKRVIEQLDIKPAQLLVEALVAEIDADEVSSLGIEWGSIDQKSQDPNSFSPGFAIINSKVSINQFQSQIYALSRELKANILSTPSVVVLDNRQAKILIGKQVSISSSSYPNNAGGTTTANSPYTTFDRVNVALHLYVRPQITRDRGIQLQIDQGNDTLQDDSLINPGTTPVFNISAIVTSVHVQSGDIIVLGGLAQDRLNNLNTDVPILKDIPGLGRLFQHNINNRRKKVLMVFIRPFIMKSNSDVALYSSGKYQHLRQDELDYIRKQESYDKRDMDTVAAPWHSEVLPKPFSGQAKIAQK